MPEIAEDRYASILPSAKANSIRQPLSWWGVASAIMVGNLLAALIGSLIYLSLR